MSSELERRLEGMLAAAPEPDAVAGEEALGRALAALQHAAPARRGFRVALIAFAVAAVLLALAAGSLAAAGALHVSLGAKKTPHTAAGSLSLPNGARGIAAIVDGRLSVVTRSGFRLQGQRASATALSPHALFVAAGIGHSLVAMAPDGRQAWSRTTGGEVVSIAWAPDGLQIAYIVRDGHRFVLRTIYGNGQRDTLIDRSVRPVPPSWRADSLAFAYVGAGGRAVVYDIGHTSRYLVGGPDTRDVTAVAFAPHGAALATATRQGVVVGRRVLDPGASVVGVGWLQDRLVLVARGKHSVIAVFALSGGGDPLYTIPLSGDVDALATFDSDIVLAVASPGETRVLAAAERVLPFRRFATLLSRPGRAQVAALGVD